MTTILDELASGFPDLPQAVQVIARLVVAALLGAVIGLQREHIGKPAGLRTHMLVALAAALFVVSGVEYGMSASDLSRIIQGLAAGIGFIGAGAILKLPETRFVTGLTTAAGIWMTAAVGVAAGLGRWLSAGVSAALGWVILAILLRLSRKNQDDQAGDAVE